MDKSKEFIKELRQKATKEELLFRAKLDYLGVKYIFQCKIPCGCSYYIADFFIPDYDLVIEIDGGYHYTAVQIERDSLRDKVMNELGYNVLRIDNSEVDTYKTENIKIFKGGVLKRKPKDITLDKKKKKRPKLNRKQKAEKYGFNLAEMEKEAKAHFNEAERKRNFKKNAPLR